MNKPLKFIILRLGALSVRENALCSGISIFDSAVNHGLGNASRMLQRAVNVADDGVIGNFTLAAIKKMAVSDVIMRLNAERLEFYCKLSTFAKFGKGWVRRVAGNLKYGAMDNEV
ncbi:Predicted Peptidoglycan domain [Rodentibacter pneumotropicus]|uniref:Predicted Peptidoglycan domain n=1 Tax=Rodentibacter pneumotropicus TaxID=758 RepID=A0A3S4XU98_9PAST|nr:Predicted Peptidoglycan domain [Rodentibacter pneumotropicus]